MAMPANGCYVLPPTAFRTQVRRTEYHEAERSEDGGLARPPETQHCSGWGSSILVRAVTSPQPGCMLIGTKILTNAVSKPLQELSIQPRGVKCPQSRAPLQFIDNLPRGPSAGVRSPFA